MATTEEILRRIEQADTARSARRSAAAKEVGELARRRAVIAEQLSDVERQLGDVLAAAKDVIDVHELARFTEIPAADLSRWLTGRKATRAKRKQPPVAAAFDAKSKPLDGTAAVQTSSPDAPGRTEAG